MLNVLFITHCGLMRGANRSLLALIEGLFDYDIRVTVVCPRGEWAVVAEALAERHIPFHQAEVPRNCIYLPEEGRRNRFKRIMMPAVLQRHSDRIAKTAAAEIVNSVERPDCVYTNSSVTDVGYFVSQIFDCPHIWHLREYGRPDYNLQRSGTIQAAQQRISAARAVVAISQSVLDYHHVSSNRAYIVPNGVVRKDNLEFIRTNRLANESPDHFSGRFAAVGLIQPAKGQQVAVAAFAKALNQICASSPEAKLDIIGPGDTAELQKLTEHLNIANRVNFPGPIHDPLAVMAAIDVHLTCSQMEGFGRVTAEAMACGAVTIGNNSGGTPEVIDHDVNGLLYDGTVEELAKMMLAIASSSELRKRLRAAAWEKVQSEFTIERYSGRIFEILREACHRPKK